MNNDTFKALEKLNAQIDVWIDEEQYDTVKDALRVEDQDLNDHVKNCFDLDYDPCTRAEAASQAWRKAVNETSWPKSGNDQCPVLPITNAKLTTETQLNGEGIEKVQDMPLDDDAEDSVDRYWSRLLYCKLLRAGIQKNGTDCYLSRLDDVVVYLERHLPLPLALPSAQDGPEEIERQVQMVKLAVIYLLELSAAGLESEILSFAQRAQRIMKEKPARSDPSDPFYRFYELWARYNKGVAYFHESRYRRAVLEFNKIVRKIQELKSNSTGGGDGETVKKYYDYLDGDRLLLLPAVIYRADLQLKLQLAYHALDTVTKSDYQACFDKSPYKLGYREQIIAAAYRQIGQMDKSWIHLGKMCKKISILEGVEEDLGTRKSCMLPQYYSAKGLPNAKGRSFLLLLEDHLSWLMTYPEELSPELGRIFRDGVSNKEDKEKYEQALKEAEPYLQKLTSIFMDIFSDSYSHLAQHNNERRRGYYQELATYLAWLVKTANPKFSELDLKPDTRVIIEMAKDLYDRHKGGWKEDIVRDCRDCESLDILERIPPSNLDEFREYIFTFYKHIVPMSQDMALELETFIGRLMDIERDREDLRIRDLQLRYHSKEIVSAPPPTDRPMLCFGEVDVVKSSLGRLWQCLKDKRFEDAKAGRHEVKSAFGDLMQCVNAECLEDAKVGRNAALEQRDYEHILSQWGKRFRRHLEMPSRHPHENAGLHFLGLRRWNSSSPAKGRSVGGGYFLYHTDDEERQVDMGIAIDPGFDFVRNLFHSGFSLQDIDIVLISHAHEDHIRDFESLVLLLLELQKRAKKDKRIHTVLTLGVYRRLAHIFENPRLRYFVEPYIMDINKEIDPHYWEDLGRDDSPSFRFLRSPSVGGQHRQEDGLSTDYRTVKPGSDGGEEWDSSNMQFAKIEIKPTRAYHNDYTGYSDSFGFLVEVTVPKGEKVMFGYTGDTRWVYPNPNPVGQGNQKRVIMDIAKQYQRCDAVLVHLGALIDIDRGKSFKDYGQCSEQDAECERLIKDKNHPYLVGMLRLLSSFYSNRGQSKPKQLLLLGEFGEELGGRIRVDLAERFSRAYHDRLGFLPIDVGVDIHLHDRQRPKVWCVQCEEFVDIWVDGESGADPGDQIHFESYGVDEALYFVCPTCFKSTPPNVLQDRLRQLYDIGRELMT